MDTSMPQAKTVATTLKETDRAQEAVPEVIQIKEEIDDDVILIEDDKEPPKNLEEGTSMVAENLKKSHSIATAEEEVKVIWHQKKFKYLNVGPEYFNTVVIYAKKYQNHHIACYRGHEYIGHNDEEPQKQQQWFCNKSLDCPAMLSMGEGKGTNKIRIADMHTCWHPVDYDCPSIDHLKRYSQDILNVVYHSNLSKSILHWEGFEKFAEDVVILDEIVEPAKAYFNGFTFRRASSHHQLENTNLPSFYTFNCTKRNCDIRLYVSKKGSYKKIIITIKKHKCLKGQPVLSSTIDKCPKGYFTVIPLKFRNRQDLALFEKVECFVKKKPLLLIHVSNKCVVYEEHIYPLISQSHNGYICHYNTAPQCSALLKVKRAGKGVGFVSLVYNHSCPYEIPESLTSSCLSYVIRRIHPDSNFKREIKPCNEPINNIIDAPDFIFKEEYTTLKKLKYFAVRYTLDLNSSPNKINSNYEKAELLELKNNVPHVIVCTDLSNNRRIELFRRHAYVVDYTAPITDLRICKESVTCKAALAWKTLSSMLVMIGEHTCARRELCSQRCSCASGRIPSSVTPSSDSSASKTGRRKTKQNSKPVPDNVSGKDDRREKSFEKRKLLSKKRSDKKKQSKKPKDKVPSEIISDSSLPKELTTTKPLQIENPTINETNEFENFTLRTLGSGEKTIREILGGISPAHGVTDSSKPSVFSYKGYEYQSIRHGSNENFRCFRSTNCRGLLRIYEDNDGVKKVQEGAHTCDNFGYKNITIMISTSKEFNQVPGFDPTDPIFLTMLVNVGNNHNILYYRGFTYIDDRSLSCDKGEFSMTLMSCNMIYMCAKSNVCSAGLSINLLESKAMEVGIHTCTINNNLTEKITLFREFQKVSFKKVSSLNEDIIYPLGEDQLVVKVYEQENCSTYLYKAQKYRESISGCSYSSNAGCKTLYLCDRKHCTAGLLIDSAKSVLEVGLHSCREYQLEEERKKIILRNDIELSINQMLQRLSNFTSERSPEIVHVEDHCNDTLKWLESNPYALREELEETWSRLTSTFNAFHLSTPTFLSIVNSTLVNVTPAVFVNNSQKSTVIVPTTKLSDEFRVPEYYLIQSDPINTISAPTHVAAASGPGNLVDKNQILPQLGGRSSKRKLIESSETCVSKPQEKKSKCLEVKLKENTSLMKISEKSPILQQILGSRTENILPGPHGGREHKYVVVTGHKGFIRGILLGDKIYVNKKIYKFSSKWDCRDKGCSATFFLNIKDEIFFKSGEHTCQGQCNLVEVEVLEKFQKKIGGTSEELWDPDLVPVFNKNGELCIIYKGFVYGNCMNSLNESTSWACIRFPCTSILLLRDGKVTLVLQHTCLDSLIEQTDCCEVFKGSKDFFPLGQFIYTARTRNTARNGSVPNYNMEADEHSLECIYFEALGCLGNAILQNGPCNLPKEHTCYLLADKNIQGEINKSASIIVKQRNLGEESAALETNGLSNLVISNVFSLTDYEDNTNSVSTSTYEQQHEADFDSEETLTDETSPHPDSNSELPITNEVAELQSNYAPEFSKLKTEVMEELEHASVLTHNIPKHKLPQEDVNVETSSVTNETDNAVVITNKPLEEDEPDDFEVAIPVTYVITKEIAIGKNCENYPKSGAKRKKL